MGRDDGDAGRLGLTRIESPNRNIHSCSGRGASCNPWLPFLLQLLLLLLDKVAVRLHRNSCPVAHVAFTLHATVRCFFAYK